MDVRNKIEGIRQLLHFDNRFQLIADRVLRPSANQSVYRLGKIEFVVDRNAGDVNGLREILTTGMYLDHLPLPMIDPITVLDLGANAGGFPLVLISAGHQIGKYVGVELNPVTCDRLRLNIERNRVGRAEIVNSAVCGEPREIAFVPGDSGSVADSIYSDLATSAAVTKVHGDTLDALMDLYFPDEIVDVCKMDVEGAEFEIFRAGTVESLKRCRYLFIEVHNEPETPREQVLRAIAKLGFRELSPQGKDDEHHHVHFFVNLALKITPDSYVTSRM